MTARFDVSAAIRAAGRLAAAPEKIDQVRQRTIATLARRLKPEAVRDIRQEYAMDAPLVRNRLSIHVSADVVELIGDRTPIGIAQGYKGRQTKQGVVFTVRRADGVQRLRHAFIRAPTRASNGWETTGSQAFERAGRGAPRFPLDRLFSASVADALGTDARRLHMLEFGQKILSAEIERQLKLL